MSRAEKIGNDVTASLRAAVSIIGPLTGGDVGNITSAATKLQNTLRNYDRHAFSLNAQRPTSKDRKKDLDKVIKDRYPQGKGYTDKMYKMMFLRVLHRLNPFFRRKDTGRARVINSSVASLTVFKLLCNVVLSTTRRLLQVAGGGGQGGGQDLQPEEFDPELSSNTQELERRLMPPATDQHQQQTETNVNRSTRRVQPTGTVGSEDEYRTMVAKHSQVVENARVSVRRHRKYVLHSLSAADAQTFRLITSSARAINDLGKAYSLAAKAARSELAPGSYSACKAFADALGEIARIVIDAAPRNREERGMERKRDKANEQYLKTVSAPESANDNAEAMPLAASVQED